MIIVSDIMRLFIYVFMLFFLSGISFAVPIITDISGSLQSNGQILITGTEFGPNGPNIHVFSDFDIDNVSSGDSILMQAKVGEFEGYDFNPIYGDVGRSGDLSGAIRGPRLKSRFDPTTQIFASYAVYAPKGSTFPHSTFSGSHTGDNQMNNLLDSNLNIYVGPSGVASLAVGARVYNLNDGSSCLVDDHTNTEVFCQLTGGINNYWNTGDQFRIYRDPEDFPRESFMKIAWLGDPLNGNLAYTNDKVLFSFYSSKSGNTAGNDLTRTRTGALQVHHSSNEWWTFGE